MTQFSFSVLHRMIFIVICAFGLLMPCAAQSHDESRNLNARSQDSVFDPSPLYRDWSGMDLWDLMKKGSKYNAKNCPDSALVCFSIISKRLEVKTVSKKEKEWLSQAYNNIGYIYTSYYGDYQRAMRYFQNAETISQSIGNIVNLAYVALNKGGLYMACNRIYGNNLFLDEIWECSVQAIEYALSSKEWPVALTSAINLSMIYPFSPRPEVYYSIIDRIRKAEIPETAWMYAIAKLMIDGTECYARGDYAEAANIYSQIEDTVQPDDLQAPRLKTVGIAATAEALAKAGDLDGAINETERWLSIAHAAGMKDEIPEGHRRLWQYYEEYGDLANAERNRLKYLELKDSLMSAKEVTAINSIPLIARNDRLSAEIIEEREKQSRIKTIAIVSGCFLILFALFILQLIKSRRRDRAYSREIYKKYIASIEAGAKERELRRRLEMSLSKTENPAESKEAGNCDACDADGKAIRDRKYRNSLIAADEENRILDAIHHTLEDVELVTAPGFTIAQLAEKSGYSVRQVSQVINECLHKNFRTVVNEIRINEVCKRLLDKEHYGQYTIEHIANGVGFQSRSNFSAIFKQVVGISAAEFRRNASLETR